MCACVCALVHGDQTVSKGWGNFVLSLLRLILEKVLWLVSHMTERLVTVQQNSHPMPFLLVSSHLSELCLVSCLIDP